MQHIYKGVHTGIIYNKEPQRLALLIGFLAKYSLFTLGYY